MISSFSEEIFSRIGTLISRTSNVIEIVNTPALKNSMRCQIYKENLTIDYHHFSIAHSPMMKVLFTE